MKIQTLSVCVPGERCINNCKFCVSQMREHMYKNYLDENSPHYDLYINDYIKRLSFARDNGCNTVILTGICEPQQNRPFLTLFGIINKMILKNEFKSIEMQTTGTLLNENYLRFLRNHVGVTTISLSVSSFNDDENSEIIEMKNKIVLKELCALIKKFSFNLRLSVNLNKSFNKYTPETILKEAKELMADQVTFRVLYNSDNADTPQDKWIKKNNIRNGFIDEIKTYIKEKGTALERLEFGAMKYDIMGLSVVLDDDCMSTEAKEELKYLILREDCKLYTKWDKKASLLF